LVEVKKSIYALLAKKINKMKKAKHKIQWPIWPAGSRASFDRCAGKGEITWGVKRKNSCNEQNISRA
jgi:hypothetical protein